MNLYPYQTAASQAVDAALAQGDTGVLLVMPTGAGKTLVISDMAHRWLTAWPETRIAVLAHTKELVEQNAEKFDRYWRAKTGQAAPPGIYCAGLKRKDTESPILFASIQSVYKRAMALGMFDVLIIDEAHHIPTAKDEGIWKQFLTDAQRANPNVRTVGLSATPYRMRSGTIVGPDALLKRIVHETSVLDLINNGYLSPLICKGSDHAANPTGLHVRQGEYVAAEMDALMNQDSLIQGAVADMIRLGSDRKSWIVFCASVAHAEHVHQALNESSVSAAMVTGKTPARERDEIIRLFKSGHFQALCNVNVLTEGFDHPGIDLVALLRPTKSPGLYYQMVGRGLRKSPGKTDCLVLDFAGVIAEHGPIDMLRAKDKFPSARDGEAPTKEAPTKECPDCKTIVHAAALTCPECSYVWPPRELKHDQQATAAPVLSTQIKPVRHDVNGVTYSSHIGRSGSTTLRVDYYYGYLRVGSEWVCIEHTGYAREKAVKWWKQRYTGHAEFIPDSVQQALDWLKDDDDMGCDRDLREPIAIHVRPPKDRKGFPEIVWYEWEDLPDAVSPLPLA